MATPVVNEPLDTAAPVDDETTTALVAPETNTASVDHVEIAIATVPTPPVIKKVTRFLNVRPFAHPWEQPAVEAILVALQRKFPSDPSMVVERLRGASDGTYRITTNCDSGGDTVVQLAISGKDHDIPLTMPYQDAQGRPANTIKEGTLLTFTNCTQGDLQTVDNSTFDNIMREHGQVIKLCELQTYKGTRIFNGNRYLVLADPKGTIPPVIQIPKPGSRTGQLIPVRITYRGQQFYCARCQQLHLGQCPVKVAFYAALEERAKLDIDTMIVSDSTLRHVDATGLRADVICMSGGRLGHVAHVLLDEPTIASKTNIIVLAGVNDITRDGETVHQFETLATTAVQNMASTVRLHGKPNLTIISPMVPADTWQHPTRVRKAEIYHDLLLALSADHDYPFRYLQRLLPYEMDDIHPTVKGTQQFIDFLDVEFQLTWNKDFTTNDRPYQGSHSAYRYGCIRCDRYLDVRGNYCQHCSIPPHEPPFDNSAINQTEQPNNTEKPDHTEQPNQTTQPNSTHQIEQPNQSDQSTHPDRNEFPYGSTSAAAKVYDDEMDNFKRGIDDTSGDDASADSHKHAKFDDSK